MKLFLATVALITAIALPALAETAGDPSLDNQSSNSLGYRPYAYQPYGYQPYGYAARAEVIVPQRAIVEPAPRVYVDGPYVGGGAYVDVAPEPLVRDGW